MSYTDDVLAAQSGASTEDLPVTTRLVPADRQRLQALADQHGTKRAHVARAILAAVLRGDHVTTGANGLLIRRRAR